MNTFLQKIDFEIIWEDNDSNGLFSEIGYSCSDRTHKSKYIKLDVLLIFKKTTFREIIDYLFTRFEDIPNNRFIGKTIGLIIKCIILYAIDPENVEIYFSDDNEFRKVVSLFKKEFGEYYVNKKSLTDIPHSTTLIQRMIEKKLLEENDDRYYIVRHILKNIEINKKRAI